MPRKIRPSGTQLGTFTGAPTKHAGRPGSPEQRGIATGGSAGDLHTLIQQLGVIPVELRKALRPVLKDAGESVRADAARRAAWSRRIPKSLRVRPVFTAKGSGVYVEARAGTAPHARAYEGLLDRRASFRHPVFGTETWVAQATRPFLAPAVAAAGPEVRAGVAEAIDTAARAGGFR